MASLEFIRRLIRRGQTTDNWEPVRPSYIVAQEAYAYLFSKHLEKPDDPQRRYEADCARALRDELWHEHQAARKAAL